VVLGESNENNIIVEMGLARGDRLYLSLPDDADSFEYTGLELMEEIKRRRAEEQRRQEEMRQEKKRMQTRPVQPNGRPVVKPTAGKTSGSGVKSGDKA
jgi:hypothetical protein